jgi:hypothetical protein
MFPWFAQFTGAYIYLTAVYYEGKNALQQVSFLQWESTKRRRLIAKASRANCHA